MIICNNIYEYYNYFINAAKNNTAPPSLIDELEYTFNKMCEDSIWKAPEQRLSFEIEIKDTLASIVIHNCNHKEKWYSAMKYVYENYSLL